MRQVLIFVAESKQCGMVEVCRFLSPFLNYTIVRMYSLASLTSFVRDLLSSIASLCCSLPHEAIPVIKLLIGRIKYFPFKNEDVSVVLYCLCEVDGIIYCMNS